MLSDLSDTKLNKPQQNQEACSYRNSLRCTRCRKRGHTVIQCPEKYFLRFQVPTYVEQLIPEVLREEYGIQTHTLLQPSDTLMIPNEQSPQFLEDLLSPSVIQQYRIGSRNPLPRQQGPPKPIHKPVYEVINTPSFFRHVVMCHNEQPSQIVENNIGYTYGYALRQGYTMEQIQQSSELPLMEAYKYQKFILNETRMKVNRYREYIEDPNKRESLLIDYKEALEELSKEYLSTGIQFSEEILLRELLCRYELSLEEMEETTETFLDKATEELGINLLPSDQKLKECRKRVQDLEKKRAKKAKLEEEKAQRVA